MNYITEINSFYDWLETNPISDAAINLWFALMHINNKAAWKTEFAVAISTLELKTSLSKSSIVRARNTLQQAGRVNFSSRAGQQSAIYSIIAFHTDTQTGHKVNHKPLTNRSQSEPQTAPLDKLKETKLNEQPFAPDKPALGPEEKLSDSKQPQQPKEKKVAAKKEKPVRLFWQEFITTFDSFWTTNRKGESFELLARDMAPLRDLYDLLQKRANRKQQEWTESYMQQAFLFFLNQAHEQNPKFTLTGLFHQFNHIISNATTGQQPATGGGKSSVQGQRAASIIGNIHAKHSGQQPGEGNHST